MVILPSNEDTSKHSGNKSIFIFPKAVNYRNNGHSMCQSKSGIFHITCTIKCEQERQFALHAHKSKVGL
jgi:hypothetical protein